MARVKKQIIVTTHNVKADDESEKKKVLRAAAYCRVSTLLEEQDFSFESQVTYYKTFIETNPMLTLVDIYGDHGLSGLRMESRPELQRLIQDCKKSCLKYSRITWALSGRAWMQSQRRPLTRLRR